jgi:hypothetical protein
MLQEKGKRKRFCKNVGRHIKSGNPIGTESTVENMFTYKVMTNINVFRMGSDGRVIGKSASTLIVGEEGKRLKNWEEIKG